MFTAAIAIRSAGDAALFGAIWLLFGAAAALAWRRRSLRQVTTVSSHTNAKDSRG